MNALHPSNATASKRDTGLLAAQKIATHRVADTNRKRVDDWSESLDERSSPELAHHAFDGRTVCSHDHILRQRCERFIG